MMRVFSGATILFGFLLAATYSREERLWCYECNTDLRQGHKRDCNDPYMSAVFDSPVACPQNESHHCLKSIVLYKRIVVTLRACVLSRQVNEYCNYEDQFPHSSIECYFCKENGCNGKESFGATSEWCLGLLAVISWMLI